MSTPIGLNGITLQSSQRANNQISTVLGQENDGIDRIKDTLLKISWKFIEDVKATSSIFAPFGWGYLSFLSNVVTIDGTKFVFYDPAYQSPPSGPDIFPVSNASGSSAGAQSNLASAISATGLVNATIQDDQNIILTATGYGTAGNGISIIGQGSVSVTHDTAGGGWKIQSRSQTLLYGRGNTDRILLTVRSGAPSGSTQLDFEIDGQIVNYRMAQGIWELYANDFSVYFREIGQLVGGLDIYRLNTNVWGCLPLVPDNFPISSSAFVAFGSGFLTSIGQSNSFNQVESWVDGTRITNAQGQGGFSLVCYHNEAERIFDITGQPLLQPALLSLFVSFLGESRIVGCIPDAFIYSDYIPIDQQVFMADGLYYRSMEFSNSATFGTLFMTTGETVGNPVPPPPPPPQSFTGIASVDGANLTYTSGDQYTPAMDGKSVTILFDNSIHTIHFVDPTHLTLVPPGPTGLSTSIQITL